MNRAWTLVVALVSVAPILAGCGDGSRATDPTTGATQGLEGSITVAAATSLTVAFEELGGAFATAHPDVEVRFTFGASSALASQIIEGAPADVYASADEVTMAQLAGADLVAGKPETFAGNEMVIVTRPGNPDGIERLADLVDARVVALCGEPVPCGRYAAEVLTAAGVTIDESRVSRGQNAGATLMAVAEGDATAGIVFATDARSAHDRVEAVAIPDEHDVVATYPIAVLSGSRAPEVANAFVAHVLGDHGRAVLAEHGFATSW